jgi:hypothetical protein
MASSRHVISRISSLRSLRYTGLSNTFEFISTSLKTLVINKGGVGIEHRAKIYFHGFSVSRSISVAPAKKWRGGAASLWGPPDHQSTMMAFADEPLT